MNASMGNIKISETDLHAEKNQWNSRAVFNAAAETDSRLQKLIRYENTSS